MAQNSNNLAQHETKKSHSNAFDSFRNPMKQEMPNFNPEKIRKGELALHVHMKNRKKFTHLYQLEKYFK